MPIKHLAIIYLIQFLLVTLPGFGIARLFKKAGRTDLWKAYVPFLNTWEMQKMTGRKMHWVFWQFIPIVGWFITPGIFIEFVKLFGRFSIPDHTGASLLAPIYMPYIGGKPEVRFIGADIVKKQRKGTAREWFDAAIFAVVAATLIRLFVFEAYVIPTGSMEKTLLVNDYLFVSKMSYGTRVPNTPLSFPFVHHTMPLTGGKSYLQWIQLPYIRWFAKDVKRNDIVVFNLPWGDTTALPDDSKDPYYDKILKEAYKLQEKFEKQGIKKSIDELTPEAREIVQDENKILVRPVDKRENYVKRCVAIAGDTLQIINGNLMINGKDAYRASTSTFQFTVTTNKLFSRKDFQNLGLHLNEDEYGQISTNNYYLNLSWDELEKVKKAQGYISHSAMIDSVYDEWGVSRDEGVRVPSDALIYPRSTLPNFRWTYDNFGPLWIPQKGKTISLTNDNVIKYRRAIETYEGNEIEFKNGQYTVNGQPNYTFKMNYYWMMGDNRHNSQDSRYWGFVPEDHIVGKPKLIWMSWEGGPRWKRLFNWIK